MAKPIRSTETVTQLFFPKGNPRTLPESVVSHLNILFTVRSMGFREVLATVIYGMYLDPNYSALSNYYACNPRSLYEQGIKPVLDSRGVPAGQSGPLNVTKSVSVLNAQWAEGRRASDKVAALGLISILEWLELQTDSGWLQYLGLEIGRKFDSLAQIVAATQVTATPTASAVKLADACAELIQRHVWGGTIPQALCGIALENQFSKDDSTKVDGARDSASTTNKTSKKVGDLTVIDENGVLETYEVTVKKFDHQRISEAVQSIRAFFAPAIVPEHFTVKVLCRPEDAPRDLVASSTKILLGELHSSEVMFEFVNIYDWLAMVISNMDFVQRLNFFDDVQEFLNGPRVPPEIRNCWAAHFG